MFSAFVCNVAQLSSSFSSAAMLKNVQVSQTPFLRNPTRKSNQIQTCHFHSFRISKALKLETRDLYSLKDLFKSFSTVIYFFDFEGNEVWFLNELTGASLLGSDFVKKQIR